MPGYVKNFEQFKASGVDAIVALVVNDVFVCEAWRTSLGMGDGADGRTVRVLCDTTGAIARSAGMLLDTARSLGRPVMRRFCALIEDGLLRLLSTEADGLGLVCTTATPLLNEVRSKKYRQLFGVPPMPRDLAEKPAAAAPALPAQRPASLSGLQLRVESGAGANAGEDDAAAAAAPQPS
jgi:hypothetical protein